MMRLLALLSESELPRDNISFRTSFSGASIKLMVPKFSHFFRVWLKPLAVLKEVFIEVLACVEAIAFQASSTAPDRTVRIFIKTKNINFSGSMTCRSTP